MALDQLFVQLLDSPYPKVALIESGCPLIAEATAEISQYFNIIHVYTIVQDIIIICYSTSVTSVRAHTCSMLTLMLTFVDQDGCNVFKCADDQRSRAQELPFLLPPAPI